MFEERISMHSIRFDLKVIVFQAWGISAALPGKEHGGPSAICKFGCFPWQVSSITVEDRTVVHKRGSGLCPRPKLLGRSLRRIKQKKLPKGQWLLRGRNVSLRGWTWHDLAQSPRPPPECGLLLATHPPSPPHPPPDTLTHRGGLIVSANVHTHQKMLCYHSKTESVCAGYTLGVLWLITRANVLLLLLIDYPEKIKAQNNGPRSSFIRHIF